MKTKRLFIIAGANGTGKTTLASEFLKEYSIEFLNADEIAKTIDSRDFRIVGGNPRHFNAEMKADRKFINIY